MIPLLLVACLFLFLSFIGQAVISLLRPRLGVLWSWFVAPSIGLAVLLIILTRLNVWGIPVRVAGPWTTVALLLAASAVLLWRRPILPLRKLTPFLIIAGGSLLYTGWPALRYGFKWISYGNDDMANYCLAAERFLAHGYYDVPLQTDLEGRDYAQHYWFMHALQQIRPGSELTVAWVSSLTRRHAHEVFMPTILMLSIVQLFGLGAVAIWKGRYRKIAILGCFLFATSPLFSLGTLYQLIAQVGGLALLLVIGSILYRPRTPNIRTMVLAGILTAGLGIYYPEVSPFVALGILLVALRLRLTRREAFWPYALFIGGVAVLTFLLIASSTYEFINTLVMQSAGSAGLGAMAEINDQSGGLVLFPWTLVPSFLPMLFGLHPFGKVGVDPLISCQILAGMALLIYFAWRTWKNLMEEAPVGYLGTIMIMLGIYLFQKGQDFGLFKLAMYAQPVITLCLAQAFARYLFDPAPRVRKRTWAALVLFFGCTAVSQIYYAYASLGTYGGGLTEVVKGSELGVGFAPPKDLKYGGIESDISNVVDAKMLAMYTQGIDTRFLSRSYMDNIANIAVLKFLRTPDPDLGPQARLVEKLSLLRFMLPPELLKDDIPDYRVVTIHKEANSVVYANNWTETSSRHLSMGDRLFVSLRTDLDHFNKWNNGDGWVTQNMYQYKLESKVKDRLVFVHSELSPHYYSSARFKAAFFQREAEPISYGKNYFHGTGEFTVFHVINPSPRLRMVVDFSRTALGAGRTHLPEKAIVLGEEDYKLNFVGDGSARIFTDILTPEYFEGQAYLTVDFGDTASVIFKKKTGLMRLYGVNYALDDRRLIGFTRDISVITDEQYHQMARPLKVDKFPDDLLNNKRLEYSGIYEDGWLARDSYFKLGPSHTGQLLSFKGFIPDIPKFRKAGVDVTVSINGQPTEVVNLFPGDFDLTRLVKEETDVTSIALHFSDSGVYADNDRRSVAALVREIAVVDAPDFASFRRLANAAGEKFTVDGIDGDGWIAKTAEFKAPAFPGFRVLKLDLEMPGWAAIPSDDLTVTVDGQVVRKSTVPRQSFESVYVPVPPGPQHSVRLDASAVFPLPSEARQRSFKVKNISFENLTQTDLFARGWHKSGYLFGITGADTDGWVADKLELRFPATGRFKEAIVQVVRYPAKNDYPLTVTTDGVAQLPLALGLDETKTLRIPLSATKETTVDLGATRSYPLSLQDPRVRAYRVVNIDFN